MAKSPFANNEVNRKFGLLEDGFVNSPHAAYAALREAGAIHQLDLAGGLPIYMITRFALARKMLLDPRLVKDARTVGMEQVTINGIPYPLGYSETIGKHFLASDPPQHTRLRRLVAQAFTSNSVEKLEPKIRTIAKNLITQLLIINEIDLVKSYAYVLPFTVICDLFGIPKHDREVFHAMSHRLITATPAEKDQGQDAIREIYAFLNNFIERHRYSAQDDLTTRLINAQDHTDSLNNDEIIAMLFLFVIAGHATTMHFISTSAYLLASDVKLRALALNMPYLLGAILEEGQRLEGVTETTTARYASVDMLIEGIAVKKGSRIFISVAAANRDAKHFSDANQFDPYRSEATLTFGYGIHYCIGASLAWLEAKIAIQVLLAAAPNYTLMKSASELCWQQGLTIRGLTGLPVRLKP